jgi:hypothetical protein
VKANKRITALAAIGMTGAVVGLGLTLAGSPAQAENPAPSASASGAPAAPDRAAGRAKHQEELAAALATELGIDQAKVAAALEKIAAAREAARPDAAPGGRADKPSGTPEERKAARIAELKTRLDAAVTAGTLTAEQSAAILKAAEAGVLPQGGPGRGGPRGERPAR